MAHKSDPNAKQHVVSVVAPSSLEIIVTGPVDNHFVVRVARAWLFDDLAPLVHIVPCTRWDPVRCCEVPIAVTSGSLVRVSSPELCFAEREAESIERLVHAATNAFLVEIRLVERLQVADPFPAPPVLYQRMSESGADASDPPKPPPLKPVVPAVALAEPWYSVHMATHARGSPKDVGRTSGVVLRRADVLALYAYFFPAADLTSPRDCGNTDDPTAAASTATTTAAAAAAAGAPVAAASLAPALAPTPAPASPSPAAAAAAATSVGSRLLLASPSARDLASGPTDADLQRLHDRNFHSCLATPAAALSLLITQQRHRARRRRSTSSPATAAAAGAGAGAASDEYVPTSVPAVVEQLAIELAGPAPSMSFFYDDIDMHTRSLLLVRLNARDTFARLSELVSLSTSGRRSVTRLRFSSKLILGIELSDNVSEKTERFFLAPQLTRGTFTPQPDLPSLPENNRRSGSCFGLPALPGHFLSSEAIVEKSSTASNAPPKLSLRRSHSTGALSAPLSPKSAGTLTAHGAPKKSGRKDAEPTTALALAVFDTSAPSTDATGQARPLSPSATTPRGGNSANSSTGSLGGGGSGSGSGGGGTMMASGNGVAAGAAVPLGSSPPVVEKNKPNRIASLFRTDTKKDKKKNSARKEA